ncbi:D-serine deaminase, pyridoxal phosphate-dependent [Halorubrum aquaticum]|uniref:D-serine deaminase, pyridoxal phosphate-dependent n=1 Tax=Halorubrum aquaticum TaxID=387340 RepID=A0A1I2ZWJ0_9EURY|nr:alanine racemase [Halorubrum aquaticum]SFH41859.1 D-serine deaminase, pyridoxal phosphate-dependent [Halorubrum aquaticum]
MPIPTTAETRPALGTPKDEIETPALLVNLDTMEANVREYVSFAEANDVRLRSHVKTHKNAELAKRQSEYGGDSGIVCQTLSEVEVMARNGIDDVYLSYMIVGRRKLERLVWLSEKLDRFATTVDGPGNIEPLQEAAAERGEDIDVILEVDVGLHRTGVAPGEPALETARFVREQPNLNFQGLLAYEAHVKSEAETQAEYETYCAEAMDRVQETVDLLESEGISVPEVKVGGTATSRYSGRHPVVTEINPGMYPFMDVGELEHRPFEVDRTDCAATVVSSVISTPSEDRAVVDAGSKTLSMDTSQLPVPRYRDDIEYVNASEEHGWLDTADVDGSLAVGDRIEFIVPHVCTTVNLHDMIIGVRDGRVEEFWPVQARGKVK